MEFRILGPLEVRGDSGDVVLRGVKQRAVLAVLLLHPNEPVHVERLALALWGEDVPASAVKTVQVYVSRLRKALGGDDVLSTTPAGYRLRVRADELDAERFARLVDEGRGALHAGRAELAARVLRAALALWRGAPLGELAFEPFAQAEIARLQEQRLTALELRVEADLAVGRHAELVAELRPLVTANPTRERLAGLLMLALYRSGRQAEALDAFHATRRILLAEIGVEPGPELRRLQASILRHDVALAPEPAEAVLPAELDVAGATPLVGRDAELAWLRERWERVRGGSGAVVAITGMRGIGKSRLAAELATAVHRAGAAVAYCAGDGAGAALRAALRRAANRPGLLVMDDPTEGVLDELDALAEAVAAASLLVLVLTDRTAALARVKHDARALQPLDAHGVRAIAAGYAARPDADVPVEALLDGSDGVPRRVHEVAREWARREASRRVGAAARRTATGRAELRMMESELTGTVVELQAARERAAPRSEPRVGCPFKGLAAFEAADAPFFFGRERLLAELVARLVGAPLLAIVGPSGSGKSSVLRAGLLPALGAGVLPGSAGWTQVVIRPGEHPLRELRVPDAGRTVVAIDQFEETFTACRDEAEREAFCAEVVRLARAGGPTIVAVRADQYGRCAAYPALAGLLAANHVLVGPLRRDELRRAIECPAELAGLRVEPELLDALVADVEDAPGGLPLLSTALLELWRLRDGRRLTHAAYEQIGGVRGAVARLAEDAFTQLDEAGQAVARSVVMRLVGLDEAGAVERRWVALDELATGGGADVARVLALLTDRRMLTVGAGTVEIAHEALLREWPRLRGWIEEDGDALRIRRSLAAAAREWVRVGRDPGALYRGARLSEALARPDVAPSELEREFLAASRAARDRERIARRRRVRLSGATLATLGAAVVAIGVAAILADRNRDVAASRDLATRATTLLATDPGLALAVALEARRRSATEQSDAALRQATLAHRATRVVAAHDGLAFGLAPSPDGRLVATAGGDRAVRVFSVASGRRVAEIRGFRDEVRALSFSADGARIATAAHDGEIAVAATRGGPRRVVARLPDRDFATSVDFVAGGETLAIGTYGGRVALVRGGAIRELQPASGAPVFAVDAREDRLVTASADGLAKVWSVATGRAIELAHPGGALAASLSPDGTRVATTDFAGAVAVWSASSGRRLRRVAVGDQPLASVAFSGDGRRIVTAAADGVVAVLAAADGVTLGELRGHEGPARATFVPGGGAIASAGEEDGTLRLWTAPAVRLPRRAGVEPRFSRNGELVVSGDDSGVVHVWSPATGVERELRGQSQTSAPQLSPDGRQVVSASFDGSVVVWDLASGRSRRVPTLAGEKYAAALEPGGRRVAIGGVAPLVVQGLDGSARVRLRGHAGYVNALAFGPDGRRLLSGSDDGTARVWDARSGALQRTLRGHEGTLRGVAWSEDGSRVATAGSDGTVRVWPLSGGEATILVGHEGPVNGAAFDDTGERVVSAGDDGAIRVWRATGGDALVVLHRHDGDASGADFGDGHAVVSAGDDGMRVTVCEVCGSIEDVLSVARTRARHVLTAAERQRLLADG